MNNKMKQLVKNRIAEAIIFFRSDYQDRKSRTSALHENSKKLKWNEMVEELLTVCGERRRSPLRFPVRFWFIRSVMSWILKWLQSKFVSDARRVFDFVKSMSFLVLGFSFFFFSFNDFLTKNGFYLLSVFYFCFWWMMISTVWRDYFLR
jgi:hypothetical protein